MVTMVVASVSGNGTGEAELAPARRVQARKFIAAHLSDPDLGPDVVAAALHISRRSLYTALGTYDGGFAAQVGLTSPAHFSRLFRRQYGQSPRELRAHPG
jgi:AraC-like DNA-binding protein